MSLEPLLNIIKENRTQKTVEEESLANDECPYDVWPLKENSKGERACPICGRIWK